MHRQLLFLFINLIAFLMFIKSNNFHKMLFSPKTLISRLLWLADICSLTVPVLCISCQSQSCLHRRCEPETILTVLFCLQALQCVFFVDSGNPKLVQWQWSGLGLSDIFHGSKYKWGTVYGFTLSQSDAAPLHSKFICLLASVRSISHSNFLKRSGYTSSSRLRLRCVPLYIEWAGSSWRHLCILSTVSLSSLSHTLTSDITQDSQQHFYNYRDSHSYSWQFLWLRNTFYFPVLWNLILVLTLLASSVRRPALG